MRWATMTFIVAIAAFAAMAFASSASAVTVCSYQGSGEECNGLSSKHYAGGLEAKAKTASLTATNGGGTSVRTVTCESKMTGQITNATTGAGVLSGLSFFNCSSTGCEKVTASSPRTGGTALPWSAAITASGKEDWRGELHVAHPSMKFTATCSVFGFPITATCEYEATTGTAAINGGSVSSLSATIVATNVALSKTAGAESVCGVKGDWSGTYVVWTPASLFIES